MEWLSQNNNKAKNAETKSETLAQRIVQGGLWVFALRIGTRGLGFIRTIILARLLLPEDFGLLGIAMLSVSAIEIFFQTGFQAALIQKKENVESYLDTAWTVSVIRGAVIFLILFFSAPLIADFFNSAHADMIIRVIAFSIVLTGLNNIGMVLFQKELRFDKIFICEFSSALTDLTVAIILAFVLRNVWALVWGNLTATFFRLCISYILHPCRACFRIEKNKFKELFGYGKWVFGSGVLVFLTTQGDDIFVGKLLGASSLGLYQMAYLLSNLPSTEITHVISRVMFPAYSKIQDDLCKLREAYLKVLHITAALSFPLAGGILALIPEFTKIVLGDKWIPIVIPAQLLAVTGLIRSVAATTGPVFYSTGRPKTDASWQAVRLIVLAVLIYPFSLRWGISGASVATLISIGISATGFCYMAVRITKSRLREFARIIIIPFFNSGVMVCMIMILKASLQVIGILQFLLLIVFGSVVYFFMIFLSDKFFNYGLGRLIIRHPDT